MENALLVAKMAPGGSNQVTAVKTCRNRVLVGENGPKWSGMAVICYKRVLSLQNECSV